MAETASKKTTVAYDYTLIRGMEANMENCCVFLYSGENFVQSFDEYTEARDFVEAREAEGNTIGLIRVEKGDSNFGEHAIDFTWWSNFAACYKLDDAIEGFKNSKFELTFI